MPKFDVYEPTMLQFFTLCPEKFRLRYVQGEPQVGSVPLFKGLVGHHVLANPDEPFDEIFRSAVTNYKTGILKPTFDLSFEDEWKIQEELTTSIHNWKNFSHSNGIEIIEREKRIEFQIGSKRILGTIDILYRTPMTPEGSVCIGDYKFGRRQSDRQLDRNLQHGLYYLGLSKLGYTIDHNAWIQMMDLIPYKTDGVKARKGHLKGQVLYPIEITSEDEAYITAQALQIIRAIENDVFFPASYGVDAPCVICEYANTACPSFKVGRKINYLHDLLAMKESVRERAVQAATEDHE